MPDPPVPQIHLTIDSWHPLQGLLHVDGRQDAREFHGWMGLAAMLTALEPADVDRKGARTIEGCAPGRAPNNGAQ